MSRDEWPDICIRRSSCTCRSASNELKVWRSEWKVRFEKLRVPFPFTTLKSNLALRTIRLNPSESPCLPDGLFPEMDRQSAPTVPASDNRSK